MRFTRDVRLLRPPRELLNMVWWMISTLVFAIVLHDARLSAFAPPHHAVVRGGMAKISCLKASLVHSTANESSEIIRSLAVAGRIPWQKLVVTKVQVEEWLSIMRAETHALDIVVVVFLSLFLNKVGGFLYDRLFPSRIGKSYEDTVAYKITDTISQAARIAGIIYFIDAFEVALEVSGIKGKKSKDISTLLAKLIYATWAFLRARIYKRDFIINVVESKTKMMNDKGGIVGIFDKISDFFLFVILSLTWLDILKIRLGNGLSSIFALGGAGTLTLTLASQDLAKRALNGLALSTSDHFYVGDKILLGDGTSGTVVKMGWLNTEIRGSNELITTIPNTQLSDIRISNRSRMRFSQVKQTLYFKHEDLGRMSSLCAAIRKEIADTCSLVVADGSRTFRVKLVEIGKDAVEVVVDCRLRIPPIGELYFEAREDVLEAIARAVERAGVDFTKKK